ncbi:hypothetical protein LR48_Vigan03g151200 [Vigna angularis]|uniref:Uncharacterized protein n=1 Tax=Phaseolus angularis TaxID=3914 RepID=A0A0L9U5S6_PHAAN|nr:hypothetical protein LR48_Vigan03g151200 [Vigna angularis]
MIHVFNINSTEKSKSKPTFSEDDAWRKTPLFGQKCDSPHSGETPANVRQHSGTGTAPPGTMRYLQRLPWSQGRNGRHRLPCSRRALDEGAAAPSNGTGCRRSISPRRPSTVDGRTPARTRSVSLSLVIPPFSNSLVSLSRSHKSRFGCSRPLLCLRIEEIKFKFETHNPNCPCPSSPRRRGSRFHQTSSERSSFFQPKRQPLRR